MKFIFSHFPDWKVFFQAFIVFVVPFALSKTFEFMKRIGEK
ncbi:hypothetical protein [Cytobacillus massiliigabonensis]|nr:hypothetical protein [Cytobacillus massiliigabonensis]